MNSRVLQACRETTDHDHDKYITTQEFNNLTAKYFTAILAKSNLASKSYFPIFVKKTDFNNSESNELS